MSAELSALSAEKDTASHYKITQQKHNTENILTKKHKTDAPSIINIFKTTNTPKIDTITKVRLSECL